MSPRVVPLPNGLTGLQMGVTSHLLTGMILQALQLLFHSVILEKCGLQVTLTEGGDNVMPFAIQHVFISTAGQDDSEGCWRGRYQSPRDGKKMTVGTQHKDMRGFPMKLSDP